MKATLFTLALLAVSFFGNAQPGPLAFRFHHVIKQKRLYTVHNINPCTNVPSSQGRMLAPNHGQGNKKIRYPRRCNTRWYDLGYYTTTDSTYYDTIYECCPKDTVLYIEKTIKKDTIIYPVMVSKKLKCNVSTGAKGITVDFWPISDDIASGTVVRSAFPNEISGNTPINSQSYFMIPLCERKYIGDPNTYVKIGFRSWAMGVGAIGFRYRAKQDTVNNGNVSSTVSSGISLNYNFGYALGYSKINAKRMTNYSVVFGGFVGLTSATLNKTAVKNPTIWSKNWDRTNPAISYGANVILSRNNFGFVFSVGFDSNIGFGADEWVYQHKPWIGIGINTSLGIF